MTESPPIRVRRAEPADAAAVAAIYREFVESTTVTFELSPPSAHEVAARIERAQLQHEWLVAEAGGSLLGYAYGTVHRAREAYRYTTEVSAYVQPATYRRGVGRLLYERLFERLFELGYRNAVAGIALPNDRSVAFHRSLGFTAVGVFRRIGYKFGEWRDVSWFERSLGDSSAPPPE